jgi:hypothetical protein
MLGSATTPTTSLTNACRSTSELANREAASPTRTPRWDDVSSQRRAVQAPRDKGQQSGGEGSDQEVHLRVALDADDAQHRGRDQQVAKGQRHQHDDDQTHDEALHPSLLMAGSLIDACISPPSSTCRLERRLGRWGC